MPRYSPAPCGG